MLFCHFFRKYEKNMYKAFISNGRMLMHWRCGAMSGVEKWLKSSRFAPLKIAGEVLFGTQGELLEKMRARGEVGI